MKSVYSVLQINTYIHNMLGQDYLLSGVSVTGEISNIKYHSSGHIYFTLKDESSALSCIIYRSSAPKIKEKLSDGDKIIATGSIGTYIPSGTITFNVTDAKKDGVGNLTLKFEELKKKLFEQGLFDKEFKKPIPKFPSKVGIVTAPTGAAVRDIISVSKRRNPSIELILYPAIVQGSEAASSVAMGIEALEKYGVDVIIVGRGGGSIEDLWAFNEEEVAYAIFQCSTPIISAVGHETDFTIADFVSDLRAPTPSAAAELAVPDVSLFLRDIEKYDKNLDSLMTRKIGFYNDKIIKYNAFLEALSPERSLEKKRLMAESFENRLDASLRRIIKDKTAYYDRLTEMLKGVSPINRLSAGMAYLSDDNGKRLSGVSKLSEGDTVRILMKDGRITACVSSVTLEDYNG